MVPPTFDLTDLDRELIEVARDAITPVLDLTFELHTVGAAIRDEQGAIFTGVNLYHFTGGPCAELVALANAHKAGAGRLVTIVAVGGKPGRDVMAPCGRDRQVFVDYYRDLSVIVPTPQGLRRIACEDLLPFSYRSVD